MLPKRIGFVGFDGVTASHLVSPADVFSTARLDSGYGNRLACYEICIIGLTLTRFELSQACFSSQNRQFTQRPN